MTEETTFNFWVGEERNISLLSESTNVVFKAQGSLHYGNTPFICVNGNSPSHIRVACYICHPGTFSHGKCTSCIYSIFTENKKGYISSLYFHQDIVDIFILLFSYRHSTWNINGK